MSKPYRLGIVMDPIQAIKPYKDTSFAMLLEAQRRDCEIFYFEPGDLFTVGDVAYGRSRGLSVRDTREDYFSLGPERTVPLADLQVILMRKDPPFDMEFIYSTYILELAETAGTLVVNRPSAIRDWNEKFAITRFADLIAPTCVDSNMGRLREFLAAQGDIVIKPLDGMGGASVFRIRKDDPNIGVILETLTAHGRRLAMAQRFIPEIGDGDKRILLVDGEPAPHALARIPVGGETRGNLAAGGRGEVRPLTQNDRELARQVGPVVREAGLLFVGLDVIGNNLTEVNVTSPTCAREIDAATGSNICGDLFDAIERKL